MYLCGFYSVLLQHILVCTEYTECQAFYPVVWIGSPHPLTTYIVLFPLWVLGRVTLAYGGGGWRGPNSDDGTDFLVLYVYYNPSTLGCLQGTIGQLALVRGWYLICVFYECFISLINWRKKIPRCWQKMYKTQNEKACPPPSTYWMVLYVYICNKAKAIVILERSTNYQYLSLCACQLKESWKGGRE